MMIGMRPFATASRDVNKKYSKILYDDIIFPEERHSCQISSACRDFIKKLLAKDPANRLGSNGGIEEILGHPWFKGLDLDAIFNKDTGRLWDLITAAIEDANVEYYTLTRPQAKALRGRSKVTFQKHEKIR